MVSPRKGADLVYENVVKQFPGKGGEPVTALDGVSFEIRQGELFCLLGPSGCGKTTLMRCTAGLETLTSGRILYGGVNFAEIPPHRRNIGMVFQKFALFPHMTVFENVAYGLRVRKTPEAEIRRSRPVKWCKSGSSVVKAGYTELGVNSSKDCSVSSSERYSLLIDLG